MQISAMLKIGNHWKSMKSTTLPCNHASPRKSRSTMLPMAPPTINPTAMMDILPSDWRRESTMPTTTIVAITPMIGPNPWPRPNAIPPLNAKLNCKVHNTWTVCPSLSCETAQCLLSWSRPTMTAAINNDRLGILRWPNLTYLQPTRSSTSSIAHGITSRRSRGIGRVDTVL